jgi:hypothetical protein
LIAVRLSKPPRSVPSTIATNGVRPDS